MKFKHPIESGYKRANSVHQWMVMFFITFMAFFFETFEVNSTERRNVTLSICRSSDTDAGLCYRVPGPRLVLPSLMSVVLL
jgi:hypothetical protein